MIISRHSIFALIFLATSLTSFAADNPKNNIAFLGVGVRYTDDSLRSHLGLPDGVGLTVYEVLADGPSRDVLLPNDILTRLDDQWLCDPRQLAAIVRMRKPGEQVQVELVRQGVTHQKRITLGERPWTPLPPPADGSRSEQDWPFPRLRPRDLPGWDDNNFPPFFRQWPGDPAWPERFRRFRQWMDGSDDDEASALPRGSDVQVRTTSTTVISEVADNKVYRLTIRDGDRLFEVKDINDKVLFSSTVNTDEEIRSIPEEHRKAYERLSRRAAMGRFGSTAREFRVRPRGPAL